MERIAERQIKSILSARLVTAIFAWLVHVHIANLHKTAEVVAVVSGGHVHRESLNRDSFVKEEREMTFTVGALGRAASIRHLLSTRLTGLTPATEVDSTENELIASLNVSSASASPL